MAASQPRLCGICYALDHPIDVVLDVGKNFSMNLFFIFVQVLIVSG